MLVLIDIYQANDAQKTALSLLMQGGLFLSLPVIGFVRRRQIPVSAVLGRTYLLTASLALLLCWTKSVYLFIAGSGLLLLSSVSVHPLLIQIYSSYEESRRGRRTVTSFVAETLGAIFFGGIAGIILNDSIMPFPLVLLVLAASHLAASFAAFRLPNVVVPALQVKKRFGTASLSLLKEDALFRLIIIAWFILGFSNHWLLMYRTNLFVEERFGFSYTASQVLLLVVVLPSAVEVLSSFLFSRLFDGMNFVKLRLLLNALHAAYLGLVLFGGGWTAHLLGMTCFGLHRGGGKLIWNLWVTRISSAERVADYMAVHGFFTGVRMTLGPALGLYALALLGPSACGWLSLGMVAASSLMFYSILGHPRISAKLR